MCKCYKYFPYCLTEQHHLNSKACNKRAPKFVVVLRCDDIYALNQWGRTPIPEGSQLTRRLTIAGLPISSRDEAHVAFAAVASRHVQAVAALAQVAVLRALVTVCGQTQSDTVIALNDATRDEKWRVWDWNMYVCMYLSRRSHLPRIPPCMCSGMNPSCCDTLRCCCTCASHLSTHPGLQHKKYQSRGLLPH